MVHNSATTILQPNNHYNANMPTEQTTLNHSSLGEGCLQIRSSDMGFLPWDNPDNVVSKETEAYTSATKDIILACCFLIGAPANVINMAVFFKQGLRDRVNLCLFMLSFFDCMFLTNLFCIHHDKIFQHLGGEMFVNVQFNEFMANNNLVFFNASAFVSYALSSIIACERCYCVLRPLKYQTLMRTRTMALIITAVSVYTFGLFYIVAHIYRIRCVYDLATGKITKQLTGDDFYFAHVEFINLLESIVFGASFHGGTIIVVFIATIITSNKLRDIVAWREEASSSSSMLSAPEVGLTKMLVGNSVFYMVCLLPGCLFRVVVVFVPEMSAGKRLHNIYFTTLWVIQIFSSVNATFNFFIYFMMGSKYRQTFRGMFGGAKKVGCKKTVK